MIQRLVLSTSYPTGPEDAAGHFVLAEVRAAKQRGEEVTVVAGGGLRAHRLGRTHFLGLGSVFQAPGALSRLKSNPLRALGLPLLGYRFLRLARSLPHFDRIDAHWLLPCAWPGLLLVKGHAEAVLHGSDVRLLLRLPRTLRLLILRQLRQRRVELRFVSSALRKELLVGADWPSDIQTFLAKGRIEAGWLSIPEGLERSGARHRLELSPDERIVVICSRLVAKKRVEAALTAASLIPHARVVVVGDGPRRRQLQARFPEVRFIGQVCRDQALLWIGAADLLLHTSLEEGAPTVIREARLLGTPVVCSASGDVGEWARLDRGIHCLLEPQRDGSEMATDPPPGFRLP